MSIFVGKVRNSSTIYEAALQKSLIRELERRGWYVIKLIQTSKNGIPDLLIHRDGVTRYIEVKRPGEKPRPLQEFRHKEIREAGIDIDVITDISQLSTF
jgi:hypothetical protein